MTILPVSYLPSVAYVAHLACDECVVDLGEHYVKRSERNRARILATHGVMDLTVHLRHANRPQTPVRDVRIDYSKRWQHQHWLAMVSAYKASPFFDYFAPYLEPFYRREFEFLADFDLALLAVLLRLAGIDRMPRISHEYVVAREEDLDLRPRHKKDPAFAAEPYVQVFSERMPFVPNLSFADLLFAEGRESVSVLRRCLP